MTRPLESLNVQPSPVRPPAKVVLKNVLVGQSLYNWQETREACGEMHWQATEPAQANTGEGVGEVFVDVFVFGVEEVDVGVITLNESECNWMVPELGYGVGVARIYLIPLWEKLGLFVNPVAKIIANNIIPTKRNDMYPFCVGCIIYRIHYSVDFLKFIQFFFEIL